MNDDIIYIGDLVAVKKKLQKFIALPDWGIVVQETTIIPADIPDGDDMGPIDSFLVFFPSTDETLTIPKNCLRKVYVIEE
jgi:hypothetical protein